MNTLDAFLKAVDENAARVKRYVKGTDGTDGICDNVGLLIGAIRLAGKEYSGRHDVNYFARHNVSRLLHLQVESELALGDVVLKAVRDSRELPAEFRPGGAEFNGDENDYFQIGIVRSVSPLQIMQFVAGGGLKITGAIGSWGYHGKLVI